MLTTNHLKAKNHMFMPGDTVQGVIKKFNLFDVSEQEMAHLIERFKSINVEGAIKPGMKMLIPILQRLESQVLN